MTTRKFRQNNPIVLGLCGKAGSGKTSVADRLAPPAKVVDPSSGFMWDHLFFAMPLYELASIRRKVQGQERKDRVLFETHEVLFDLFGRSPLYGLPPYDEFIEFVRQVSEQPITYDEEDKPRSYLQTVGTLCREIDPDIFVKNINRILTRSYARAMENEDTEDLDYICVVSDVRQPNEAEWVASQPNGVLVRFDASDEVRRNRLLNRDGKLMTEEEANHHTESIERINPEDISIVIDTDNLTLKEHVEVTRQSVFELLGLEMAYA